MRNVKLITANNCFTFRPPKLKYFNHTHKSQMKICIINNLCTCWLSAKQSPLLTWLLCGNCYT